MLISIVAPKPKASSPVLRGRCPRRGRRGKGGVERSGTPAVPRATAQNVVICRTEPVRREQPTPPRDTITWGGHVPRRIGRDRCTVGSPRRSCLRHGERQYRYRRGSRWLAVCNGVTA